MLRRAHSSAHLHKFVQMRTFGVELFAKDFEDRLEISRASCRIGPPSEGSVKRVGRGIVMVVAR